MSGVVASREALAAALVDHAYTYPDSFCECGAYINGDGEWRDHVADTLLASGAVVTPAACLAGLAEDEAMIHQAQDIWERDGMRGGWPALLRSLAAALATEET